MPTNKRTIEIYRRKYGKTATEARNKQRTSSSYGDSMARKPNLLMSAYNCWNSMSDLRTQMRRNEEFVYGDQWSDRVYDQKNKRSVTERTLLTEQGLQPSQYNIIRNVLRTTSGIWSNNKVLPVVVAQKDENQTESEVLTATLHTIFRKDELWKLFVSQVTQLQITGISAVKSHWANRDGQSDLANDYVDPFAFFVDNTMKDPRYKDCSIVGCYWDLSIDDIVGLFSNGNKERAAIIRSIYSGIKDEDRLYSMVQTFTDQRMEKDFLVPGVEAYGLGRVIEVWRKESAECFWIHDYLSGEYYPDFDVTESELKQILAQRKAEQAAMGVMPEDMMLIDWEWGTSNYWKYYYLTPVGEVLKEGKNPFWHEKPPFTFELHDFYVGKIYPFVKDLIDTQKQINKLSAISELLSKFSAKSLMFMPTDQIDDENGYGLDYIEDKMTDYDAVIPYKPKAGVSGPNYVNTVAQAFTPLNVVNMYLKLSENVSGVFGALQGAQPTAGTPAQMYAQQSQNSAVSLTGLFESVNSFFKRVATMNVQLMQQFYTDKRYVFDQKSGKRLLWDPERVKNVEHEVTVGEQTDTPAYRLMVNDLLFQLKQYDTTNMLDLRGMIEAGNLPFKESLLNYLNKREQEVQQAQLQTPPPAGTPLQGMGDQGGLPADLQQQLGQYQFSPQLMAQFAQLPPEVQKQIIEGN